MNCPNCKMFQKNHTPLVAWKGCPRCKFGEKEYNNHLRGCKMNISSNWDNYRQDMLKSLYSLPIEMDV